MYIKAIEKLTVSQTEVEIYNVYLKEKSMKIWKLLEKKNSSLKFGKSIEES